MIGIPENILSLFGVAIQADPMLPQGSSTGGIQSFVTISAAGSEPCMTRHLSDGLFRDPVEWRS